VRGAGTAGHIPGQGAAGQPGRRGAGTAAGHAPGMTYKRGQAPVLRGSSGKGEATAGRGCGALLVAVPKRASLDIRWDAGSEGCRIAPVLARRGCKVMTAGGRTACGSKEQGRRHVEEARRTCNCALCAGLKVATRAPTQVARARRCRRARNTLLTACQSCLPGKARYSLSSIEVHLAVCGPRV
jgi:hypothetical protein